MIELERARRLLDESLVPRYRGDVAAVSGQLVEAAGVPAAVGELVRIDRGRLAPVVAEVVGFQDGRALLMPHGAVEGISPDQRVTALGRGFRVGVGPALLGRTLDGFGAPLDGGPAPHHAELRAVRSDPPPPLSRPPIDRPLATGVRAIDGLLTLGRGQRLGIFAGSGVGKSTLLGQIARGTEAETIVICLVGERGREVRDFLEEVLGEEGRARAVTVVATSDRSPIERYLAPFVATTVAEHFRDAGQDVLLVMDSVTRFAGACREIGLAAGEPATARGFPPSFFATVPKLVERLGRSDTGSITGLLTVLLDADDPNEPVADTLRGLLDGHVLLSRELATRGHYPAIDVLPSLSRLMERLACPEHARAAARLRSDLAAYREGRDLVEIGAYKPGANPELDRALERLPLYDAFCRQGRGDATAFDETIALLRAATEGAA